MHWAREGKTDVMTCIVKSQPHGFVGNLVFWTKFAESSPDEQKNMLKTRNFKKIYDAMTLSTQYVCFNCIKKCPQVIINIT